MSDLESSKMKKVTDVDYEKLTDVQKMYMKRIERFNKGRATEHIVQRTSKRKYAGFFFATVVGIYFYTIFAVKQERLGEEFDQRYTEQKAQSG